MKTTKLALFIIAFAVVLCCVAYAATTTLYDNISIGATENEDGGAFTIVSTDVNDAPTEFAGRWYGGNVTKYSAAQAQTAGVPVGYTGNVWKVTTLAEGDSTFGCMLDFSDSNIPIDYVKAITFRIWVGSREHNSPSQIFIPKAGALAVSYDVEANTDKWYEFTLSENYGWRNKGFASFADADGILDKINFSAVYSSALYIDSVEVEYYPVTLSGNNDSAVVPNGLGSTMNQYTAKSAADAGITLPEGSKGTVWKFDAVAGNGANLGVTLDFSSLDLDAEDVESISFRIHMNDTLKNFYVPAVGKAAWACAMSDSDSALQVDERYGSERKAKWQALLAASQNGTWHDFVFDITAFRAWNSFTNTLAKENGKLGPVNIRLNGPTTVYIDSVSIQLTGGATIDGEMLGAQIRTNGDRGLRFGTAIATNGDLELSEIQFDSNAADNFYAGTLVTSKADMLAGGVTSDTLTHATMQSAEAVDVKAENIFDAAYNDNYALYTAVVTKIPDDSAELVARAYIRYTSDNGITYKYFYFDPIVRSIAQVDETNWTE